MLIGYNRVYRELGYTLYYYLLELVMVLPPPACFHVYQLRGVLTMMRGRYTLTGVHAYLTHIGSRRNLVANLAVSISGAQLSTRWCACISYIIYISYIYILQG